MPDRVRPPTSLRPVRPAGGPRRRPGGPATGPVTFGTTVLLTKSEVFGACQALADADRALLRSGGTAEAAALGDLFELLEQRLSVVPLAAQAPSPGALSPSWGRYSSDSELTQ